MQNSGAELSERMLSQVGRIPSYQLTTGHLTDEDWQKLNGAADELAEVPIYVHDDPDLTAHDIAKSIHSFVQQQQGRAGLVIIDDGKWFRCSGKPASADKTKELVKTLKNVALECKIPIILTAEVDSQLEERSDKRPLLSDVYPFSPLGNMADMAFFLYRPAYYDENCHSEQEQEAQCIVQKNSNGPCGIVYLGFNGACLQFEDGRFEFD